MRTTDEENPQVEQELHQYNQPALSDHDADYFSDTTGLLDQEEDEWNQRGPSRPTRQPRSFALLPQSAKITYGLLVLLVMFLVGSIAIVSYRLLFKKPGPEPEPRIEEARYTSYLRQSWIPTLCEHQSKCLYNATNTTEPFVGFVIQEYKRVNESIPPGFCIVSNYQDVDDTLKQQLNKFWPEPSTWPSAWEQNGVCMPSINRTYSQQMYFENALYLRQQTDFLATLQTQLQQPLVVEQGSRNETFITAKLQQVQMAVGAEAVITCINTQELSSIIQCTDQDARQFRACPEDFVKQQQRCSTEEIFIPLQFK